MDYVSFVSLHRALLCEHNGHKHRQAQINMVRETSRNNVVSITFFLFLNPPLIIVYIFSGKRHWMTRKIAPGGFDKL